MVADEESRRFDLLGIFVIRRLAGRFHVDGPAVIEVQHEAILIEPFYLSLIVAGWTILIRFVLFVPARYAGYRYAAASAPRIAVRGITPSSRIAPARVRRADLRKKRNCSCQKNCKKQPGMAPAKNPADVFHIEVFPINRIRHRGGD